MNSRDYKDGDGDGMMRVEMKNRDDEGIDVE
jgi:hypothetical protein